MEERINVAEILRNCQSGMNLDCVCFENVVFDRVDDKNRIRCLVGSQRDEVSFNEYGCLNGSPSAKCVIYPKGETTWNNLLVKFNFKDGDILHCKGMYDWVFIYKNTNNSILSKYVAISGDGNFYANPDRPLLRTLQFTELRFATQSEKQELFDAIKNNGYEWDPKTKTLEKLPKFKVGDWVVNIDEKVNQVVAIDDNCDGFTLDDGSHCNNAWNKLYRLWTIQDAEDGDVLVHNSFPFIFMGIKNGIVKGICTELGDTILNFGDPKYDNDYYPATKEQRALLFQKMKESGYEWDAEKKEKKKIEQKLVEWGEEDKNKIDFIKGFITMGRFADTNTIRTIWELLDSLCPSWKPSDKQMEQLGWIAEQNKNNMIGQELMTLYNDLKKLKE